VSRNTNCACGKFLTPRMRWRVVCGLGVTIASFVPMITLSNVDLPTLGAPMIVTKPERKAAISMAPLSCNNLYGLIFPDHHATRCPLGHTTTSQIGLATSVWGKSPCAPYFIGAAAWQWEQPTSFL